MTTETEWVPAEQVPSGTLVRATLGQTSIVGIVHAPDEVSIGIRPEGTQNTNVLLISDGWKLFMPKPKVELPTEPGVYQSDRFPVGLAGHPYTLTHDGWWFRGRLGREEEIRDLAPFTRLESRADTAKAVIEFILGNSDTPGNVFAQAREHFGVTDA